MNLFDFQVFKYVAKFQSISLAAKELHMTQPAITHIINKMEKSYALALFERSRSGTILTDSGKKLLVSVERLLEEYERLEGVVAELQGKHLSTIVLATYPSVTLYCLAECMQSEDFNQSKYVLSVREGNYGKVVEWLSSGKADFSICRKENVIKGFRYEVIGDDPYVMVSPTTVPANLTIEDIKKYPFVMPLSGCKEELEPYLIANNIIINKVMESESITSTLALAQQLKGVTIVPLSSLNKHIRHEYTIQPIEINIQRELIMQWSSKKEVDTSFMSFIRHLLFQLQERAKRRDLHIEANCTE
ncbi:LysR family transcriptional regulator [Priestia taiwanensis]|uniref:LysR family transcriptional regulator n=1 Tax=Priestia taiwanensis TaxID=1347902 RepID=A0A917EQG4_9BACI|nr:LysR family transcriptional regulator [Priestia taiwanensis]MBM7364089.1 LysR family tdc operon transcriptional activator [Priestia taiwanensis]GGE71527.1 LysR family transcriptional regulator [Priestia taiwanensis]